MINRRRNKFFFLSSSFIVSICEIDAQ
jgi:hypothetical protein